MHSREISISHVKLADKDKQQIKAQTLNLEHYLVLYRHRQTSPQ